MSERYFVLNFFEGKSGKRVTIFEEETYLAAIQRTNQMTKDLLELSGQLYEQVEIFVGSRSQLDKYISSCHAREEKREVTL